MDELKLVIAMQKWIEISWSWAGRRRERMKLLIIFQLEGKRCAMMYNNVIFRQERKLVCFGSLNCLYEINL